MRSAARRSGISPLASRKRRTNATRSSMRVLGRSSLPKSSHESGKVTTPTPRGTRSNLLAHASDLAWAASVSPKRLPMTLLAACHKSIACPARSAALALSIGRPPASVAAKAAAVFTSGKVGADVRLQRRLGAWRRLGGGFMGRLCHGLGGVHAAAAVGICTMLAGVAGLRANHFAASAGFTSSR